MSFEVAAENCFCIPHKNRQKQKQYTQEMKFSSHISDKHISLVFPCREM